MNRDFEEMLRALSDAAADFMVIGAHAVAFYATPRATGDLDIWVRPTQSNAERVWKALVAFGAPLDPSAGYADLRALPGVPQHLPVVRARRSSVPPAPGPARRPDDEQHLALWAELHHLASGG
jgi:hypothetical protein